MSISQKKRNSFQPAIRIFYAEQKRTDPDIEQLTDNGNGTFSAVFAPAKDWKQIFATIGSISVSTKASQSDEGKIYEHEITFSAPGDDIETLLELESLLNIPLIIRCDFAEVVPKLFGDLMNFCFLEFDKTNEGYISGTDLILKIASEHDALTLIIG